MVQISIHVWGIFLTLRYETHRFVHQNWETWNWVSAKWVSISFSNEERVAKTSSRLGTPKEWNFFRLADIQEQSLWQYLYRTLEHEFRWQLCWAMARRYGWVVPQCLIPTIRLSTFYGGCDIVSTKAVEGVSTCYGVVSVVKSVFKTVWERKGCGQNRFGKACLSKQHCPSMMPLRWLVFAVFWNLIQHKRSDSNHGDKQAHPSNPNAGGFYTKREKTPGCSFHAAITTPLLTVFPCPSSDIARFFGVGFPTCDKTIRLYSYLLSYSLDGLFCVRASFNSILALYISVFTELLDILATFPRLGIFFIDDSHIENGLEVLGAVFLWHQSFSSSL